MAKLDDRMNLIGSAILSQARQEAKEITQRANEIREREIAAFEDEIVVNMFGKVQQKAVNVRLDSVKTIAGFQKQSHRELLLLRQELVESVFQNVRDRLLAFAVSPDYGGWLFKIAQAHTEGFDHSASVIFLNPRDLSLAPQLQTHFENAPVKEDKTIQIGGFQLKNLKARILVDETLDARLQNQRSWFLEHCGLNVM